MAVKFKELDDRLKLSPLSDDELSAVDWVEKYLDDEIVERYKGGDMRFEMGIIKFERTTDGKHTSWPEARKKMMAAELKTRFEKAGWSFKDEVADIHDRYGSDYVVIKGGNN